MKFLSQPDEAHIRIGWAQTPGLEQAFPKREIFIFSGFAGMPWLFQVFVQLVYSFFKLYNVMHIFRRSKKGTIFHGYLCYLTSKL